VREVRMALNGMRIAGLLDSDGDIVPSARPAEPPCKPSSTPPVGDDEQQ
jgi:hypothetical protein